MSLYGLIPAKPPWRMSGVDATTLRPVREALLDLWEGHRGADMVRKAVEEMLEESEVTHSSE